MRILVTGATGYVGGRLVSRLVEQGRQVRVLVRDLSRVAGRPWVDQVEVFEGDLFKPETLTPALADVQVAYYLVHGMGKRGDFAKRDRLAAQHFAKAAAETGVEHVIYLGGLFPKSGKVSSHLSSRAEVGQILSEHLPVTELRAGPIIGSGSASFEMVRYLTERLPIMLTPKWVNHEVQPIAIRDILAYLQGCLDKPALGVVDVGADVLTFKEMMQQYAQVRKLKRVILPVPVLAPGLAARWVGLVTPVNNALAVPLVQGVVHSLVADLEKAQKVFPEIKPIDYQTAVALAVDKIEHDVIETRWTGAMQEDEAQVLHDRVGLFQECRKINARCSREALFKVFTSLGGERGYLVYDRLWQWRGLVDKLLGGPGIRRGRRHPQMLLVGEAMDFWRVEKVAENQELRLRAEMKVPGRAWLQWRACEEEGQVYLEQVALFQPRGLLGWLYWWLLFPIHRVIFTGMARKIVRVAETQT